MSFENDEPRGKAQTEVTERNDSPFGSMGRRKVLAGLAGIGLAGGVGMTRVLAQDSTPTADDGSTTTTTTNDDGSTTVTTEAGPGDMEAKAGEHYQDFLGKLATNLGSDADTVDMAIRDALKAIIDETFDAGDISKNAATEIKDRIDSSASPIGLRVGIRAGGMGDMGGGMIIRRGGGPGRPGKTKNGSDETEPATDSTPTT